ncbi:MAG: hypothetical protein ACRDQ4_12575 [Pseudonocardiaceae bacterium]
MLVFRVAPLAAISSDLLTSLVIALLLITYPRQLRPAQLAGTGLVQAIPLVATATVGHLLYGDVHLAAATPLMIAAAGAGLVTTVLLRAPQPRAEPLRQLDPADVEIVTD